MSIRGCHGGSDCKKSWRAVPRRNRAATYLAKRDGPRAIEQPSRSIFRVGCEGANIWHAAFRGNKQPPLSRYLSLPAWDQAMGPGVRPAPARPRAATRWCLSGMSASVGLTADEFLHHSGRGERPTNGAPASLGVDRGAGNGTEGYGARDDAMLVENTVSGETEQRMAGQASISLGQCLVGRGPLEVQVALEVQVGQDVDGRGEDESGRTRRRCPGGMGKHQDAHDAQLPLIRAVKVNGGHHLAAPGCHHDGDI